jgi:hypothetical protein
MNNENKPNTLNPNLDDIETDTSKREISDQAVDYLATHNLVADMISGAFTAEEGERLFPMYKNRGVDIAINTTFKKKLPPLLNSSGEMRHALGVAFHSVVGNEKYWLAKKDWAKVPQKEKHKLIEFGPYSDGVAVNKLTQSEYSLLNTKLPFLETGVFSWRNLFAKLLTLIDRGEIVSPELDRNSEIFYHLYTDSASRIISLISRGDKWDDSELNGILLEKLGQEKFDFSLNLFENYGSLDEFREIFKPTKATDLSPEVLAEAVRVSNLMIEVYRIINQFLREKVVYSNELSE